MKYINEYSSDKKTKADRLKEAYNRVVIPNTRDFLMRLRDRINKFENAIREAKNSNKSSILTLNNLELEIRMLLAGINYNGLKSYELQQIALCRNKIAEITQNSNIKVENNTNQQYVQNHEEPSEMKMLKALTKLGMLINAYSKLKLAGGKYTDKNIVKRDLEKRIDACIKKINPKYLTKEQRVLYSRYVDFKDSFISKPKALRQGVALNIKHKIENSFAPKSQLTFQNKLEFNPKK